MSEKESRRIVRIESPLRNKSRCPECNTKLCVVDRPFGWECPKCKILYQRKRRYSKYPEKKSFDHYEFDPEIYYRINPSVKFLKPSKAKQKVKGREYIHYRISTTVPEEWKDGVKLTIEPIPPGSDIKKLRQRERDLNESGPPDAPKMQKLPN